MSLAISMVGFIPFFVVYILTEFSVISLTSTNLLVISESVAIVDVVSNSDQEF